MSLEKSFLTGLRGSDDGGASFIDLGFEVESHTDTTEAITAETTTYGRNGNSVTIPLGNSYTTTLDFNYADIDQAVQFLERNKIGGNVIVLEIRPNKNLDSRIDYLTGVITSFESTGDAGDVKKGSITFNALYKPNRLGIG